MFPHWLKLGTLFFHTFEPLVALKKNLGALEALWGHNELPAQCLPKHVAIIMDGNRRWAKKRVRNKLVGHRAGGEAAKSVIRAAGEFGIKYLTLYAFSTENWSRPEDEVSGLMLLLQEFLEKETEELHRNNVQFQTIGEVSALPQEVQQTISRTCNRLKNNTGLTLSLALSYGSRDEILKGIKSLAQDLQQKKLQPEQICEQVFSRYLFTNNMPDPDLIIRTSGEQRLSNFLLWQSAYAELYFTEKLWPDFGVEDFKQALDEYAQRNRRYGKC